MLDRFLRRNQKEKTLPKVDILSVGKVEQIDWESVDPSVPKDKVIESRIQLMEGSYSKAPGLIIDVLREIKATGKTHVGIEEFHDALTTMLQKSGRPVDLEDRTSIDSALMAYWDSKK